MATIEEARFHGGGKKSIHGAEWMGLNRQIVLLKEKIKHLAGKTGREKQRRRDIFLDVGAEVQSRFSDCSSSSEMTESSRRANSTATHSSPMLHFHWFVSRRSHADTELVTLYRQCLCQTQKLQTQEHQSVVRKKILVVQMWNNTFIDVLFKMLFYFRVLFPFFAFVQMREKEKRGEKCSNLQWVTSRRENAGTIAPLYDH